MGTGLNDDEAMLVATVREFVDKEVRPTVREVEHANEYPEAWIEQMKRIGIYGLAVPEEYGGTPVSMPCYVLVTQELARGWMSLAGAMGGHTVVAKLLTLFGTDEQKQRYLPPMATGELRATMALTEPGGGSDLQNMTTTALSDGEELVVNDVPVVLLIRAIELAVHRDEKLPEELLHDQPPFKLAASESRSDRVPSSLWAAVSWPSRNAPCSVMTSCVFASRSRNWTVATDTEMRVSSAYISYV